MSVVGVAVDRRSEGEQAVGGRFAVGDAVRRLVAGRFDLPAHRRRPRRSAGERERADPPKVESTIATQESRGHLSCSYYAARRTAKSPGRNSGEQPRWKRHKGVTAAMISARGSGTRMRPLSRHVRQAARAGGGSAGARRAHRGARARARRSPSPSTRTTARARCLLAFLTLGLAVSGEPVLARDRRRRGQGARCWGRGMSSCGTATFSSISSPPRWWRLRARGALATLAVVPRAKGGERRRRRGRRGGASAPGGRPRPAGPAAVSSSACTSSAPSCAGRSPRAAA